MKRGSINFAMLFFYIIYSPLLIGVGLIHGLLLGLEQTIKVAIEDIYTAQHEV